MVEQSTLGLDNLPLSEEAKEAYVEARRLGGKKSHRVGLKRQLLFLAGVLRREEPEALEALRDAVERTPKNSPREMALQDLERWRGRLVAEGDEAVEAFLAKHPDGDRQRLRQLVRLVNGASTPEKAKRASRELFAALREVVGV